MKNLYLLFICLFISNSCIYAQHFPGGITDAEVWYFGDWEDIGNNIFKNSAQTDIKLKSCFELEQGLFNFNSSIVADKLCISYNAPLENSTGRDIFFVGEPNEVSASSSHLATVWDQDLSTIAETDSIVRNFIDLNNKNVYGQEIYDEYNSINNANINFYHTNHYNIDKKFKSYGALGETKFFIGKQTSFDPNADYPDTHFNGNFPEFISFTRELSANERNRVESYLALKYGITLNKSVPYLSSKNKVFWSKSNNKIFPERIFGLGKDGTSNLNQLQSESAHLKNHLVAAFGEVVSTNLDKQESVNIPNDHFLVFGDNGGKPNLINDNEKNIKFWEKVWLAQRTGEKIQDFPVHFDLHLTPQIIDHLQSNEGERLWLMKDNNAVNNQVSDFSGEYIEYHEGTVDYESGIGHFGKIHFDNDLSVYDQYTIGVGPRMIVQVQVKGCEGENLEITVDITGGKPKYSINVESEEDGFDIVTSNSTYTFEGASGVEYEITVTDETGLSTQVIIEPEPWNFNLNLGPDQFLSAAEPNILLNAGSGIDDPNATYSWMLNGLLLSATGSTIDISEPGVYSVAVTSGDQSCTVEDEITITRKGFNVEISTVEGCSQDYNAVSIDIFNGYAPYSISLTGDYGTVNHVTSGSMTIFDMAYGAYEIEVTDSEGSSFVDDINLTLPTGDFGLDIYTQLDEACDSDFACLDYDYPGAPFFYAPSWNPPFEIDASIGVSNPNMTYEWSQDGIPLGINSPEITFVPGSSQCIGSGQLPFFTVTITDITTNCSATQSFYTRGMCAQMSSELAFQSNEEVETENTLDVVSENTQLESRVAENILASLVTKVYPNPSQVNATFTYEVTGNEIFDGIVEVFTFAGAKIESKKIKGKSKYSIPLNLNMSGMYLIRITSSIGIVKTDRIIIN